MTYTYITLYFIVSLSMGMAVATVICIASDERLCGKCLYATCAVLWPIMFIIFAIILCRRNIAAKKPEE